jgi:hypothetical protein
MNSVIRPNYRRARALALEIEAAKNHLVDCGCDLRGNANGFAGNWNEIKCGET